MQELGFITIGSKIDPDDWQPGRKTADIVDAVLTQAQRYATKGCQTHDPPLCGNIILLHDGGGNREATIEALPQIIEALRSRGFRIVSVPDLLGKTRAEVMPQLAPNEVLSARLNDAIFTLLNGLMVFIYLVFLFGDVLMSARLLGIGRWPRLTAYANRPRCPRRISNHP